MKLPWRTKSVHTARNLIRFEMSGPTVVKYNTYFRNACYVPGAFVKQLTLQLAFIVTCVSLFSADHIWSSWQFQALGWTVLSPLDRWERTLKPRTCQDQSVASNRTSQEAASSGFLFRAFPVFSAASLLLPSKRTRAVLSKVRSQD